jgi:hypothetical protein
VATAGPFDYERGICLIQGLAKLEALYGVDLRAQLGSIAAPCMDADPACSRAGPARDAALNLDDTPLLGATRHAHMQVRS